MSYYYIQTKQILSPATYYKKQENHYEIHELVDGEPKLIAILHDETIALDIVKTLNVEV